MYKDYTIDFSSRCKKIIDLYYKNSKEKELDVSFLLMIASSSFVIPFEKIRNDSNHIYDCNKGKKLKDSYFNKLALEKIELKQLDTLETKPDSVSNSKRNIEDMETSLFLSIIRNAISHGNIQVIEQLSTKKIGKIAFISEKFNSDKCSRCNQRIRTNDKKIYNCLVFKADEFKRFLDLWLNFLKDENEMEKK